MKRPTSPCSRSYLLPLLLGAALLSFTREAESYAMLTHEAIIDLARDDSIQPLLLQRFPGLTGRDLETAQAYAYGGCVIQDLGYYPFSKHLFSDLPHYVRSGDFVQALLREARNANELAFAAGALSHYVGDAVGHSLGVNPSTAITFPGLARKYGPGVTYEDDPAAHVRTEFGFDVAEITRRRFAPRSYHRHIGFLVARALLDRAFEQTYGLTVRSILGPERSALLSYRESVRSLLPLFAQATLVNFRGDLAPESADSAHVALLEDIARASYRRQPYQYTPPGFQAHVLAIIIRIIPKVCFFKILGAKIPLTDTDDLYVKSLNVTLTTYRSLLRQLAQQPGVSLPIQNLDLDTGNPVIPGRYRLTDQTYAKLLARVVEGHAPVSAGLKRNLEDYYRDPAAPITTKEDPASWHALLQNLAILDTLPLRP